MIVPCLLSALPTELGTTEIALLAAGALMLAAAAAGGLSSRFGVPVLVLFLGLGMLAGSDGVGGIAFASYSLTYRVGTVALVLILFDGGLRTPLSLVRSGVAPATVLATLGVLVTAGAIGAGAHALGFSWTQGLLLGAIVSPTDAAAVFSVLRGGGTHLRERVGAVVELESGLNDPMAVLLTVGLASAAAQGVPIAAGALALRVVAQLAIGAAVGALLGLAARAALTRVAIRNAALYPVATLAFALVAYGAASLAFGSGFLAVYVAGVTIGNARLPSRASLLRVHDFVAWAGQIVMFVVLGLLAFPHRVVAIAPTGLVLAALLAFAARPIAVAVCLGPFRFGWREIALVGWVGLRGAVPIVLATIPVLAHVEGAETLFDVVFFVVLVSALVQGSTTRRLAEALQLADPVAPTPAALVEIESVRALDEEILSFFIAPPFAVCGARIEDIPFPPRASVMLVVRDAALVAPRGDTELRAGDHVFVFCPRADAGFIRLLFGRAVD